MINRRGRRARGEKREAYHELEACDTTAKMAMAQKLCGLCELGGKKWRNA